MRIRKCMVMAVVLLIMLSFSPSCSLQPEFVNGEYQIYTSKEGHDKMLEFYQEMMSKWTVPYEELDVDTSYGKTHVILCGAKNKKNLVILHGSGGNSSGWYQFITHASRDFRVCAVDIIGQPGKSRLKKLPKDSKAFTDWLEEVFCALSIDKAVVAGLSLGGYISQWFEYYHPERIDKLILLSSTYTEKTPGVLKTLGAMKRMLFDSPDEITEWVNGGPLKDAEVKQFLNKYFSYQKKHVKMYVVPIPAIPEAHVKMIRKPVLIIMGEKDTVMWDSKESQAYIRKINNPHIRFEMIPGEGHLLAGNAELLNNVFFGFLK